MDPELHTLLIEQRTTIQRLLNDLAAQLATRPQVGGRELALCRTKLQEARHWLGECQLECGCVEAYPN